MKNTQYNTFIFIGSLALLLLSGWGSVFSVAFADSITPNRVVELVNESRLSHGLDVVLVDTKLNEAASLKAHDMLERQYFAHDTPTGETPWYWFGQVEYVYRLAGENLAIDFEDPQEQHTAWMESALHRKNILKSEYEDIGVAVERGVYKGEETVVVVQLFGTKLEKIPATKMSSQEPLSSKVSSSVLGSIEAPVKETLSIKEIPFQMNIVEKSDSLNIFIEFLLLFFAIILPLIFLEGIFLGHIFFSIKKLFMVLRHE